MTVINEASLKDELVLEIASGRARWKS
jgi:hypothetical protein